MQLQDVFNGFLGLSPQKKFLFVGVLLTVVGSLAVFGFFAGRPDFGVLYSDLKEQEAAEVMAKLQEHRIPYRIEAGGRVIEVPREQIYEIRLTLAGEGMSRGGIVGFEIFDEESWSTSQFVEGVKYRRALQGELARTIMSMAEVESARVHLVLPERSPFVGKEEGQPKASVVLQLRGGQRLPPEKVKGVVHLVSGSVDGLLPDAVAVIDSEGRLLTRAQGGEQDTLTEVSTYQLEYKRSLETGMEQRLTRMLERVTGEGNAIVRVSAEVDFRQVEKQEEIYDPDSVVVRSEQKRAEKTGGLSTAGVPGIAANTPGRQGARSVIQTPPSEKQEKILNYEINKITRRMVESPGMLLRLSVAVLLRKQDKMQDGELEGISALVKGAVGFDAERGDQVEVALMPFESGPPEGNEEVAPPGLQERIQRYLPYALKYGALLLGALLLVFVVLRPMLRSLSEDGKRLEEFQRQLPESLEKAERAAPQLTGREQLIDLVKDDPARAAQVIRLWLREG